MKLSLVFVAALIFAVQCEARWSDNFDDEYQERMDMMNQRRIEGIENYLKAFLDERRRELRMKKFKKFNNDIRSEMERKNAESLEDVYEDKYFSLNPNVRSLASKNDKPEENKKPEENEKPKEDENPEEKEKPKENEKPEEKEKPKENKKPEEKEKHKEKEKPEEKEKTKESEKPGEKEKPEEKEKTEESEKPEEKEKPEENKKPEETEKPEEKEKPFVFPFVPQMVEIKFKTEHVSRTQKMTAGGLKKFACKTVGYLRCLDFGKGPKDCFLHRQEDECQEVRAIPLPPAFAFKDEAKRYM